MFASIGYGAITVNQVLFKLIDFYRKEIPKQPVYRNAGESSDPSGVVVKGMSGLLTRFAGCCNPVPGDDIVGFVTRGRGVVIHRADCPNIKELEREEGRILPAEWTGANVGRFVAGIIIKAKDQGVALSVLTNVVSDMRLMITGVNSRFDKNKDAVIEANIRLNGKDDIDLLGRAHQRGVPHRRPITAGVCDAWWRRKDCAIRSITAEAARSPDSGEVCHA